MEPVNVPSRDKYWKELSDSEKIERIRGVIKHLSSKVDSIEHMAGLLLKHSHSVEGKLQIPLEYGGENMGWRLQSKMESNDEVFF